MGAREVGGPLTVVGVNAVRALLESGRVKPREVLLKTGPPAPRLEELRALAGKRGVPVRAVPRETLDRMAGDEVHQGAAAILPEWPYLGEGDLTDRADPKTFLLILDHLQDAGNMGAILRSAHLCGATGVVIPNARAVQVTAAVLRASAGAAAHLDIHRVANLVSAIRRLKEAGAWVFGLDAGGTRSLLKADLTVPLALVIGGEHQGLSRLVRERCDLVLSLPMAGRTGSFNASVAAGVALFEVMRQRNSGK